jgi:hypothetical protein
MRYNIHRGLDDERPDRRKSGGEPHPQEPSGHDGGAAEPFNAAILGSTNPVLGNVAFAPRCFRLGTRYTSRVGDTNHPGDSLRGRLRTTAFAVGTLLDTSLVELFLDAT